MYILILYIHKCNSIKKNENKYIFCLNIYFLFFDNPAAAIVPYVSDYQYLTLYIIMLIKIYTLS